MSKTRHEYKISYDKEADAVYIRLSNEPYSHGIDLDNERRVDYDINGNPRGIELLCISMGVVIENLPQKAEVARILGDNGIKIFAETKRKSTA
jgi:uncharacterized protein YuzE